jgi:repressor LexA
MRTLTVRQKEILNFLAEFIAAHSFPPTLREIGEYFEISLRAVQDHLFALEKKGFIATAGGEKRSRSIKLVQKKHGDQGYAVALRIPIIGSVAAGKPVMSDENFDGYISVAASDLKPGKRYFILKVCGTSMIGAGILDGDLALIEQRQTAENGQIVVAMVDGAITLKRFYRDVNKIRLEPENPDFPTQTYRGGVQLAGVLSRIMREYQ